MTALTWRNLSRSFDRHTVYPPSRRETAHGKTSCLCVWSAARTPDTRTVSRPNVTVCAGWGGRRLGRPSRTDHRRRVVSFSRVYGCPRADRFPETSTGDERSSSGRPQRPAPLPCSRRRWTSRAASRGFSTGRRLETSYHKPCMRKCPRFRFEQCCYCKWSALLWALFLGLPLPRLEPSLLGNFDGETAKRSAAGAPVAAGCELLLGCVGSPLFLSLLSVNTAPLDTLPFDMSPS